MMKTITIDQMIQITTEMFNDYVEPVALSLMCGEVPNTTFIIHRIGSEGNDIFPRVRFKNTVNISIFKCDIWLDDILLLCRKCKMYLVTESVFRVVSVFVMLYPLYQTQYMDFRTNVNTDYDSMLAGAGYASYRLISDKYQFQDEVERVCLDLVYYYSMSMINCYKYAPKDTQLKNLTDSLLLKYQQYMLLNYNHAFRLARRFKSYTNLVSLDGFIRMEPTRS